MNCVHLLLVEVNPHHDSEETKGPAGDALPFNPVTPERAGGGDQGGGEGDCGRGRGRVVDYVTSAKYVQHSI